VDFSIIIPVFNKAELTRNCLRTLPSSLVGAGNGEVIVIDNASSDNTADVLAEFPWIRAVRNERNLGFAGANNQGARLASGRFLVLLNNDTQALPGWLAAMLAAAADPKVGAVGARLLFPDNTIQHAGVVVAGTVFGRSGFSPFHRAFRVPADEPEVLERRDFQVVTGACLLTPRDLYLDLGGLDEVYWNGYEDVDYCFKVRARGLRVVYEPSAKLYHFESQSGPQRFRRVLWNVRTLGERWKGKVRFDALEEGVAYGRVSRLDRGAGGAAESVTYLSLPTPPTTVLVCGRHTEAERASLEAAVRANRAPVAEIIWNESASIDVARAAMRVRGERFLAFVDAGARLNPRWLDELIAQISSLANVGAATYAPELPVGENVVTLATDARCTLLSLRHYPQHLELREADTLGGAVADILLRAVSMGRATRGARESLGELPPCADDEWFRRQHARPLSSIFDTNVRSVEAALRSREVARRGLVSIVTLSWNAPEFTRKALESIKACTSEPYEVVVVDNGSEAPTREMLAAIDDPHVRVVYNATNRGFAGGSNDGIASALGDYVVLLNNDVIVTDGWIDGLLDPFHRIPGTGVTAPRSNIVVGHQQLPSVQYQNERELAAFAAARREEHERSGYFCDRAIGLCLCIDRAVLDRIGGLDERFGLGNFEDDDFCIRVRAAGYGIYVCNDVFIHHFGSRSFAANNVDYTKTMAQNWEKFAQKWGYTGPLPRNGYDPRRAIARGFDPRKHYFAIDRRAVEPRTEEPQDTGSPVAGAAIVFHLSVRDENDWKSVAEFTKRFARAFRGGDRALLAIGVFGDLTAETIAARVRRVFARAEVDLEASGDVEVSDEESETEWLSRFSGKRVIDAAALDDRSPSALRRVAGAPR